MTQILLDWYKAERARIYSRSQARPGDLLIGTQVWGEKFLDSMARYMVPTMLAPANIATLAGRARMLIYTRPHEVEAVWQIVRPLEACGVEIEIAIAPPLHMAGTDKLELSNIVLGAIHCAMMAAAGHWMMGLHPTYADHVYSDMWFRNFFRVLEEHPEGVAQYSITGQIETAKPELEVFRQPGFLAVPALDLGDITFRHHHQQQRPFVLNDLPPGRMSPTSFLVWRGKDRIWLQSPHMNPLYLNAVDCLSLRPPTKFTVQAPLDTRGPYVFGRMPYVPTVDDEMESIEMADVSKPKRVDSTFEDFAQLTHMVMRWCDDYMPFWRRRSVLRIREHDLPYVDEAEVERQFTEISARLMAMRDRLATKSLQEKKTELGWIPTMQEIVA